MIFLRCIATHVPNARSAEQDEEWVKLGFDGGGLRGAAGRQKNCRSSLGGSAVAGSLRRTRRHLSAVLSPARCLPEPAGPSTSNKSLLLGPSLSPQMRSSLADEAKAKPGLMTFSCSYDFTFLLFRSISCFIRRRRLSRRTPRLSCALVCPRSAAFLHQAAAMLSSRLRPPPPV